MASSKLLAVVGPTAVGKSELGLRLAREFSGEIVSADSRQIYRHMDIGTAKPSSEDIRSVRHHLIDIVEPDDTYSLARFLSDVSEAIRNVQAKGQLPLLLGGSGQYVWAVLEGWQVPKVPPDIQIRDRLERRAREEGIESLYRELASRAPEVAARVDQRNPRRVIRALEVAYTTGSDASGTPRKTPPDYEIRVIGLTMKRGELYRRIDERVDAMIAAGWVEEVQRLMDMGFGPDLPSMSSFGYGELVSYLSNETTLDEAVRIIKSKTHRFARQQYAWFRLSDERIRWFDVSERFETVRDEVAEWLHQKAISEVDYSGSSNSS